MDKLKLKNKTKICYIVNEKKLLDYIKKVNKFAQDKNCDIIELRIDNLLNKDDDIQRILLIVEYCDSIIKLYEKKSIFTLRTLQDGGMAKVNKKQYLNIIEKIYKNTEVDAIDIEYRFYRTMAKEIDSFFKQKKQFILSYHDFKGHLNTKQITNIISKMRQYNKDVIKIAIKTHNKKEVFDLLETAKKIKKIEKKNDFFVIIAMGKIGLVSRIYNEYTNTKIVYIDNSVNNIGPIGNINIKTYKNLRKKLN